MSDVAATLIEYREFWTKFRPVPWKAGIMSFHARTTSIAVSLGLAAAGLGVVTAPARATPAPSTESLPGSARAANTPGVKLTLSRLDSGKIWATGSNPSGSFRQIRVIFRWTLAKRTVKKRVTSGDGIASIYLPGSTKLVAVKLQNKGARWVTKKVPARPQAPPKLTQWKDSRGIWHRSDGLWRFDSAPDTDYNWLSNTCSPRWAWGQGVAECGNAWLPGGGTHIYTRAGWMGESTVSPQRRTDGRYIFCGGGPDVGTELIVTSGPAHQYMRMFVVLADPDPWHVGCTYHEDLGPISYSP